MDQIMISLLMLFSIGIANPLQIGLGQNGQAGYVEYMQPVLKEQME